MNEFYNSARGQNPQAWLEKSKKTRESLPFPSKIKIVYPSKSTVQNSVAGEPGGGTLFCRRNQWKATKFPRQLFHDSRSRAGDVLMHTKVRPILLKSRILLSKLIYVQMIIAAVSSEEDHVEEIDPDIEIVETSSGWAYIGSHNFTPSAWGNLSGTAFSPVLNVRNFIPRR